MASITLAFSNHRPETLEQAAQIMRRHQVVFLEEAADPSFAQMLNGLLPVDDYIAGIDTEYPEFSRLSCQMMKVLHAQGIRFEQVEPFIERLIDIHERLADQQTPADILKIPELATVYAAEKEATRTLIDFYAAALEAPFDGVIAALKAFAKADAERFRLRDCMRADALARKVIHFESSYVEAGSMHFWLRRQLKRRLSARHSIDSRYLMAQATRAVTGMTYLLGPGDELTFRYIFNPLAGSAKIDLLAARSLIFNKIVAKSEMSHQAGGFPHMHDEWQAIQRVAKLGIEDCAHLFSEIRTLRTSEARRLVETYLKRSSLSPWKRSSII